MNLKKSYINLNFDYNEGLTFEFHLFVTQIIFVVPCEWDEWGEWGTCSKTCGGGLETRTRKIKQREAFGGAPCVGNTTESRPCAMNECPGRCIF